jgi:hypothetical protein
MITNNIVWMHMPLYNNSKETNIYISKETLKDDVIMIIMCWHKERI